MNFIMHNYLHIQNIYAIMNAAKQMFAVKIRYPKPKGAP